jgi:hypothetical protein
VFWENFLKLGENKDGRDEKDLFFGGQFDDGALKTFLARRHKAIAHQGCAVNGLSVGGEL